MKSLTLARCLGQGHKPAQHSPDGFDKILECPVCCMAWLVKGITGEEIRLTGSSYERRLIEQAIAAPVGH